MEQSRVSLKDFLSIFRKRRVLTAAFEPLETMLNEPVVNYQRFV
jgi:hypothetical protein